MKQLSVLIISLFLLSLGSCATTTQKKTTQDPDNLSGDWAYSGVIEADNACGGSKTENWTATISQKGDMVKLKQKFGLLTGKKVGNKIFFEKFKSGKLTVNAGEYTVSADGNTLIGKGLKWTWGSCGGVSDATFKRKTPVVQKNAASSGLSGSWKYSGVVEADEACGGSKTESWVASITQTGDVVKLKQKFGTLTGKRSGNKVFFEKYQSGKLTVQAAAYVVSADENTMVGKGMKWTWGTCGGVSDATFKRKAPVKAEPKKIAGNWKYSAHVVAEAACGGEKTENWNVKISQIGAMVIIKQKFGTITGKLKDDTIIFPKSQSGKLAIEKYNLMVSKDRNTLTGKDLNWTWDGSCNGTSSVTYVRQ